MFRPSTPKYLLYNNYPEIFDCLMLAFMNLTCGHTSNTSSREEINGHDIFYNPGLYEILLYEAHIMASP